MCPSPGHLPWFLPWFLLLPDPCKALQCRPKERCKLKGSQATCVPSLVATCWGWGDPHYHTFDGLDFDFQGTCTYTMAESCGNDTRLVPFKVEGKNDIRGGVKSVSYVSLTNIKVYGQHISIHRKEVGKVRVSWPKMEGKWAFPRLFFHPSLPHLLFRPSPPSCSTPLPASSGPPLFLAKINQTGVWIFEMLGYAGNMLPCTGQPEVVFCHLGKPKTPQAAAVGLQETSRRVGHPPAPGGLRWQLAHVSRVRQKQRPTKATMS